MTYYLAGARVGLQSRPRRGKQLPVNAVKGPTHTLEIPVLEQFIENKIILLNKCVLLYFSLHRFPFYIFTAAKNRCVVRTLGQL